jgi:uncharacterized membrane protein (UPF0127 family)
MIKPSQGNGARRAAARRIWTSRAGALLVFAVLAAGAGAVSVAGAITGASTADAGQGLASFSRDSLVLRTADGGEHRFEVELALSPEQRSQGLMFRRSLAADAGMLFVYPSTGRVSMWMKNTLIPLDMLFIADDGTVEKIVERTVPLSLATISSDGPVRAVLEINGGSASRLGLRAGDRVLYRAFEKAP